MKRPTAKERVLHALERAGRRGLHTAELCHPAIGGVRFSARILELRGQGHRIDAKRVRDGSWHYTLISTPQPAHPSRADTEGAGTLDSSSRDAGALHQLALIDPERTAA